MLNIWAVREVVLISFMAILLNGLLAHVPNVSMAQTGLEASVTNSTDSNFLTYEDTTRGFIMQYPSDWKKSDYPPTIPVVFFMSPAQNATDNLFESVAITVEHSGTYHQDKSISYRPNMISLEKEIPVYCNRLH